MRTCHAHIVDHRGAHTHPIESLACFFRDWKVARPRTDHRHVTDQGCTFRRIEPQRFRKRIVNRMEKLSAKLLGFVRCDPCGKDMLILGQQPLGDGHDCFDSFA
jgi:hypothetical protein